MRVDARVFGACSPVRVIHGRHTAGSGVLRPGRGVVVAEGAHQVLDGDIEGVGEGVPGGDAAGGTAVLQVDQGSAGQAAAVGEFVEGPAALAPQGASSTRSAVRSGSGGKIVTPPSDGAGPCPVSADFCTIWRRGSDIHGAGICTTVRASQTPMTKASAPTDGRATGR
jgi:hypothetical protein